MSLLKKSDYLTARRLETEAKLATRRSVANAVVAKAESTNVPLFVEPNPKVHVGSSATERGRSEIRGFVLSGEATPYDYGCDHCGTRLYNTEPDLAYMSSPPRYRAACPGCGWIGFTS
jgi:hypothetical protein